MRHHPNAFSGFGLAFGLTVLAALGTACSSDGRAPASSANGAHVSPGNSEQDATLTVRYLEIVTPEVDATCETYSRHHGISFGEPVPEFGNARIARLSGGGWIGVRAPLASHEAPVVRPYMLVEDIESAVEEAAAAGAEIAHPPLEIPGHGTFAIYILGGIQHGLWQH